MHPRTPMMDVKLHNGDSIVRRMDWQAWRKTLEFDAPPKTEAQIAADARASATVKDIRDNRDPNLLGHSLAAMRMRNVNLTMAECADELSRPQH